MPDQYTRNGNNTYKNERDAERRDPQRRTVKPTDGAYAGAQPTPRRVYSHSASTDPDTPRRVSSLSASTGPDTPRRVSSLSANTGPDTPRRVSSHAANTGSDTPRRVSSRPVNTISETPGRVSSRPLNTGSGAASRPAYERRPVTQTARPENGGRHTATAGSAARRSARENSPCTFSSPFAASRSMASGLSPV